MTREERARKLGVSVDDLPDGRGRHGNHVRGSRHPRWSGGRAKSEHGYLRIFVGKAHPLADPNGYAYEHHLVVCSALGRLLAADEVVHHRNGDKLDNRLENLEVLARSEHHSLHIGTRERDDCGRLLPTAAATVLSDGGT